MGRGVDAILRLAETRHLDIVAMWDEDAPPRRDLDYGDVEADADRMQLVLEMRSYGHTYECINDGRPGDEATAGCPGCDPRAADSLCPHGRVEAACEWCQPYAPSMWRDGGPL